MTDGDELAPLDHLGALDHLGPGQDGALGPPWGLSDDLGVGGGAMWHLGGAMDHFG